MVDALENGCGTALLLPSGLTFIKLIIVTTDLGQ